MSVSGDSMRDELLPSESKRKQSFWETLTNERNFKWTLLIPLLAILGVMLFYPLIYCIGNALQEYSLGETSTFIGFDNYRYILHDAKFWIALGRTFQILVICVSVELALGLGIALLFSREFKGQNAVRGLCLLPLLVMPLAMSMEWNFILQYDFGLMNQIITWLGGDKIDWWMPGRALYTVCAITIWQWLPFSIFVLVAGLRGLPKGPFEAARVDGASGWFTFRKLTLPMLTPLIMIIVVLRTMWLIRLFDPLYGTTHGGAGTETLDYLTWRVGFTYFDIGQGSAIAMLSLFLTIVLCAVMFRVLMKSLGVIK